MSDICAILLTLGGLSLCSLGAVDALAERRADIANQLLVHALRRWLP